jgi:Leucine-rich repeat (LRR) protein
MFSLSSTLTAQVLTQDSLALVALYDSTNGDNWNNNSGWKNGPVSGWYGITVSENRVTQIILNGNNLTWKLPAAIGDLTECGVFYISVNGVGDTLPLQLGNMSSLSSLSLMDNNFTGKLPSTLGNLSNLIKFYAEGNAFSDTIPGQLGNLPSLQYLDLGENQFEGPIPPNLGNLPTIFSLRLDRNQLSGTIPPELGRLTSLDILDLSNNQLTGPLPDSLANLSSITTLNLSYNQIDGLIPETLGNMHNVVELSLSHNQLSGGIPGVLGNVIIQTLDLSHNQLSGPIPAELGNIDILLGLFLNNNQLEGTIPGNLYNAPSLGYVHLSNNQLLDTLAVEWTEMSGLTELYLDHNYFHGTIPPEFGNALQIRELHLEHNQLEGEIPLEFVNHNRIRQLYLNANRLTHMPDISEGRFYGSLKFEVQNNLLDFSDLEPNVDICDRFEYAPQGFIGEEQNKILYAGDSLLFSVSAGGTASTFHWFRDSVEFHVTPDSFLLLENVQIHDAGEYYCSVSNTVVEDLTLFSYPLALSVIDTTAPSVPEEVTATPGDSMIQLNWRANEDPDSVYYRIYMATTPEPAVLVDSTSGINDTTIILNGLANDTTYYIRLTAVDWSQNESAFSNEIQVTPKATGMEFEAHTLPKEFALDQNFSNPFNPKTTIGFTLPRATHVRIEMYDLMGKRVGVYLNAFKKAGVHHITIHAGDLSSGIYFYRLTAGDFQQIRRMVLLR